MKPLKNSFLPVLTFLAILVAYSSCKPKKIITQAPAPVVAAKETPKPAPTPADTDGDGVPDSDDDCPDKPGTAANYGCPTVKITEPTFNYQNILFEFNSSVLKTSSYLVLDDIAKEIKKYPDMNFHLNGHSSAEGTEERNIALSIARANAVKNYLVNAGIPNNTLIVKGFGESMPIKSNDTETGRQLNRRVEIKKF